MNNTVTLGENMKSNLLNAMSPYHFRKHFAALLSILLLVAFTPIDTDAQDKDLTPYKITELKSVASAQVSPDGKYAAYTLNIPLDPKKKNGYPHAELHMVNLETGSSTPFITGDVNVRDVSWMPSGKAVSFLLNREGDDHTSLYKMPVDGGGPTKLYEFKTSISSYDWAPGGDKIVFTARNPERKESNDLPYKPDIYHENGRDIYAYTVSFEGDQEAKRIKVEGTVYQVDWSPAGDRIALTVSPTPYVDDYYMNQKLRIVSADSREVVTKIDNPGKIGEVVWSKNGEMVAFLAAADRHDTIAGRLMVADASTPDFRQILEGYKGKIDDIAWVNNTKIRFAASRGVWTVFSEVNKDGSGHQTMVEEGGPVFNAFSMSADGSHSVLVADSPQHPNEVYMHRMGEDGLKRVTHHNKWLEEYDLGQQEKVTWTGAEDWNIEGVLIHPNDADEGNGKPYPLITVVHGGPEAHHDMGWNTNYLALGQVAAAEGFAVFYPNYRGSTGRGQKFATVSQGNSAKNEFGDVVDGVDYLVDEGLVKEDQVGVTGASYGGYATGWLSTKHTEKFAAGVMFVGLSDLVSFWGTTDIPQEEHLVHFRKHIWEDWDLFLKRSPIYHADDTQTPLLILDGKEDTRVDPGQSIEMYNHLKFRSDVPVRLVMYPGEAHGNSRSTSQYDYMLRSLRWMKHYLTGPGGEMPDNHIDAIEDK